jgi:hypothetical protein
MSTMLPSSVRRKPMDPSITLASEAHDAKSARFCCGKSFGSFKTCQIALPSRGLVARFAGHRIGSIAWTFISVLRNQTSRLRREG